MRFKPSRCGKKPYQKPNVYAGLRGVIFAGTWYGSKTALEGSRRLYGRILG